MLRCLARVCALVLLAVLASGQVVEPPFANEPPEVIGRIAPLYPPSATPAAATKKRWSSDTASPTPPPLTPAPSVEVHAQWHPIGVRRHLIGVWRLLRELDTLQRRVCAGRV